MTEYYVFKHLREEDYALVARVPARGATSAIRAYLDGSGDGGTYVAAPVRSWKPVKVQIETKTALKFS